jgi:hypothetical protein
MHLKINIQEELDQTAHNYEAEALNYCPDIPVPHAYCDDNTFSSQPQNIAAAPVRTQCGDAAVETHLYNDVSYSGMYGDPGEDGFSDVRPVPADVADVVADAGYDPGGEGICATVADGGRVNSYCKRVVTVLQDSADDRNRDGRMPATTSVACYWCCHTFPGQPFGLPVKFRAARREDGRECPGDADPALECVGNFCSLSCAAAFNTESRESHDIMCERNTLLAYVSRRVHGTDEVRVAPPRTALAMFGGFLSIQQFREHGVSGDSVFLENMPPMKCLAQQIEEIDNNDIGNKFSFVPIDKDRVERGRRELTLRREKTLINKKSTLDHSLIGHFQRQKA